MKSLNDYLVPPYTIEIIPDNGAWFAQVKELPGCMTEVDEWDQILPAIEEAKRLWIERQVKLRGNGAADRRSQAPVDRTGVGAWTIYS